MKCYHKYCNETHDLYSGWCDKKYGAGNWEILLHFDVLYSGWECDSNGWVIRIKDTDEPRLLLTNHGGVYEGSRKDLENRLAAYISVIDQTSEAITML